jgi:glycerophosphoryl diester phosphodiesterase
VTTSPERPVRLIAHRGIARERPENTLPAFLRALELGADGVELDVQATRDGVVIVHHDEIPCATPPSPSLAGRRIDTLTFDELQGFSVDGAALIPTLAEVLAALRGRVDVYVELKGHDIEGRVLDVIHQSPAPARCGVHSFDHEAIRRCRAKAPGVRGGILFDTAPGDVVAAMRHADARDVWPREDLIDAALVSAVHGAGGRVLAWTVNAPARATLLARMGVDALCTDALTELREALSA